MRLIHIFTATSSWRDIVKSIYALDRFADENIIIAHDQQPLPAELKNTRYIVAPAGLRGFRFWWWAGKQARSIIRNSSKPNEWIVSEQVVGITLFILRCILRVRCRTMVFLVFPTFKFFQEKGWQADKYALPMTLGHRWFHVRDMIKRSVIEVVSILASDVVAANSEEILRSVQWLAGGRKLRLLPNSVSKVGHGRSRESKANSGLNLLFIAATQPHKGVALAMEVFERLQKRLPDAKLTIVGGCYAWDKDWFDGVFARYQERCGPNLSYRGKVPFDELAAIYEASDIFFFPSFYEGSPRVVCEAMQYGCAVVTSDLSGNRVIDPEGEALQYFPAGDIEGAMTILERLAKDRERLEQVRAASRRVIESRFSSERVAEILLNIYRPMLDKKAEEVTAPSLAEKSSAP
jgi:glycosyltransferase involved in cell wall biosynthesis